MLELAIVSGVGGLAGCSERAGTPGTSVIDTTMQTQTNSPTATRTPTDSPTATPTAASFDLGNLEYPNNTTQGETIEIGVGVTNTGGRKGRATVILEFGDTQLTKDVELAPGGTDTVTFEFKVESPPGTYRFSVFETETGEVLRRELDVKKKHPKTLFVGPDGSSDNPGTKQSPLGSIQTALNRVEPGETVHVLPGRYSERVETVRSGKPDKPITITGPPDAVYTGGTAEWGSPLYVRHNHIHITGLTFDGLRDPENKDDLKSYSFANVRLMPNYDGEGKPPLLTDIKVKPHAVGNTRGNCVHVFSSKNVEVGEFKVHGPAGVDHFVFDKPGHDGEIVYIGSAPNGWEKFFNGHVDRTQNVHVHHIDNSAGHVHSEIADAKVGTKNILIEYCTSVGAESDPNTGGGMGLHLGGENGTARWNVVKKSSPTGILVGNFGQEFEKVPDAGTGNSVYGNRISGTFEKYTKVNSNVRSIALTPEISIDELGYYCGNEFEKPADGNPGKECPADVPVGDGVGHTGGDSPWKG